MTSISKAWVTMLDSAVDADSPLDQALMEGLRDDLVHLREWLGANYIAGAVQDHDHDGVNSALVPVGSNYLRNGSFESGTTGWTITPYTGGSSAISTASQFDGEQSLELTSTVLANGGAQATSDEFLPVSGGEVRALNLSLIASASGVSSKVEAVWYDKDQAQISTSTLLSHTSTPTSWTRERLGCVAPAAARYMRLRFTGGVPAVGSSAGTVRFDGISLTAPGSGLLKVQGGSVSGVASLALVMTDLTGFKNKVFVGANCMPVTDAAQLLLRLSTNGGSSYDSGVSDYGYVYDAKNTSGGLVPAVGGGSSIVLCPNAIGNASNEGVSFEITFNGTDSTANNPTVRFHTEFTDTAGNFSASWGGGARGAAQDTDAFEVRFHNGNGAWNYALYVWN